MSSPYRATACPAPAYPTVTGGKCHVHPAEGHVAKKDFYLVSGWPEKVYRWDHCGCLFTEDPES